MIALCVEARKKLPTWRKSSHKKKRGLHIEKKCPPKEKKDPSHGGNFFPEGEGGGGGGGWGAHVCIIMQQKRNT